MNAVFTIVAKNYLSLALTLGDSLKKTAPEVDFIIFLIDSPDGIDRSCLEKHKIQVVNEAIIKDFKNLAFKYNVTEYCTAVKPFIFDYLFLQGAYENICYIDPDIYFYQTPNIIFDLLHDNFCILTPHILNVAEQYDGNTLDKDFLFAGIYNLGFIALKNSAETNTLLKWWCNRLASYCYGDRMDNLHVDQKWMDFVPSLFRNGVLITGHRGLNIAYWNIHERKIFQGDGKYYVQDSLNESVKDELVFLHFSGLNPFDIYRNKQCKTLDITMYPVWETLAKEYAGKVLENNHQKNITLKYSYSTFENGDTITHLHRRMYRRLEEMKMINNFTSDPFEVGPGSYFSFLNKNKLLVGKEKGVINYNDISQDSVKGKLSKVFFLLRFTKKILGISKYATLIRGLQKILAPENQILLTNEFSDAFSEDYQKRIS